MHQKRPTVDKSVGIELRIKNLIDGDRCYEAVRQLRWGSEIGFTGKAASLSRVF